MKRIKTGRGICKKCGSKFSYKMIAGLTQNTCKDCKPNYYGQINK